MPRDQILIKNGLVCDPLNGVNCERRDIAVKNDKIVDDKELDPQDVFVIDANRMLVFPGGIDVHSHMVGPVISNGLQIASREIRRTMNLNYIGRSYARMGWTMAVEPSVPPLFAKQAVMELCDVPIIDKAFYALFGNNWLMMEYVREGLLDKLSTYVSWLLRNVKGFAVKLANPGGGELWSWRGDLQNVDDVVPYFNVTPREIIEITAKANEQVGLPHSIHLHCNNTLRPGNFSTTLDSIKMVEAIQVGNVERKQTLHIAHAQYNCYGGDDWHSIESRAQEVAKAINSTDKITADLGQITFGETVFASPDGCLTERIAKIFKEPKVANCEFEIEDTSGAVKLTYSKDDPISSLLWATGLELALLIDDPWKLSLTSNSPNGGLFSNYPEIISWLMSRDEREKIIAEIGPFLETKSSIAAIEREYDLHDICVITRAGPAKALGISKMKGHLGIGADADIAIYDLDPENLSAQSTVRGFSKAAYTIKSGKIVVKDGQVVQDHDGQIMWAKTSFGENLENEVLTDLDLIFKRFYSVNLDNFLVRDDCFRGGRAISMSSLHQELKA